MKMLKIGTLGLIVTGAISAPAVAATLKVHVDSIKNGDMLASKYAFCAPAAQGHTTAGGDINPSVSWSRGPRGTKSYAVILFDPQSPAEHREMMNKEGVTMTADIKRHDFFHWVLVDIPQKVRSIKEGEDSNARVVHGKPATPSTVGVKGLNDYTKVTAANDAMKGQYFGYDGPCPPWNDDLVHQYHFTVYALSVKSLNLPKDFDAAAAQDAMKGKILAQGEAVGMYTQNPAKGAKVSP